VVSTRRASTAAAVAALALSGCGLTLHPVASRPADTPTQSPAHPPTLAQRAGRTHELATPAPAQTAAGGWRSPVEAVQVFATTYINWTATTVATRLRALAQVSVGQARAAMTLAASQVHSDGTLARAGIGNSGGVEAIGPVRGHPDQYAVVTREQTTATNTGAYAGLQPAWHVSLATVTRVPPGLWVLSAWQPES
jgi:hypothetical protein